MRLLTFKREFTSAEAILLEQDSFDEAIKIYKEIKLAFVIKYNIAPPITAPRIIPKRIKTILFRLLIIV